MQVKDHQQMLVHLVFLSCRSTSFQFQQEVEVLVHSILRSYNKLLSNQDILEEEIEQQTRIYESQIFP